MQILLVILRDNRTMTKNTKAIILWTIIIVVIYLSFKLRNDEADNIQKFGVKGIGTLTHHGLKTIDISYTYQGNIIPILVVFHTLT
jgi:hypothetical protein